MDPRLQNLAWLSSTHDWCFSAGVLNREGPSHELIDVGENFCNCTIKIGGDLLAYLGRRSYALYLIHYPIVAAVILSRNGGRLSALPNGVQVNLLLIAGVLAMALLLAETSWRLIESPAQKLRQAWTNY